MSTKVGSAHLDIDVDASNVSDTLVKSMDRALDSVSKSAEQAFTGVETRAAKSGAAVGSGFGDGARAAERAVNDLGDAAVAAARAAESAELKLSVARNKAIRDVRAAEAAVKEARAGGDVKTVLAAEERLGDVRARATSSVIDAEDRLAAARKRAGNAAKAAASDVSEATDESIGGMSRMDSAMEGLAGQAAKLAGPLAAALGGGALLAQGAETIRQIDGMNDRLGLTGEAAAIAGGEVKTAMRSGVAESAADAAGAIEALNAQFGYLGFEGEQTAAELSDNFLAFAKTFEVDIAEATQMAGQLVKNGLAPDVESAADLMTTAMRRVPVAMRDELPEIMAEYGTYFQSLGFNGEQAFEMLINASEDGKFALDKTGDALKEFGIRATDLGDTGAVEALEKLGLAGENIQARLLAGGDTARAAFTQVTDALLGVTDPAAQAEAAIALFGTPLEDLDKTKLPSFLESLSATGEGMAGAQGASQALADSMANTLDGRLNMVKGTVAALAGDGFMWLWDVMQNNVIPVVSTFVEGVADMVRWVTDSEIAMTILAGAIAGVATALIPMLARMMMTGIASAIGTVVTAFKAVRTAVLAANTALMANPFVAIAAAVVALVAGLTYFFTQTETGKRVWESLVEAFRTGWEAVKGAFAAAWEFVQPILDGLWTALKVVGAILFTAVVTPFQIGWNLISAAILAAWDGIIRPAWDAMQVALGALGSFFQWVWTGIIQPVWNALGAGIRWVYDTIIAPSWEALKFALFLVGEAFRFYWENVINPVWTALGNGIRWVYDTIIAPAWDALKVALGAVGTFFQWVWNSVIKPAWDALGNGIRWVLDTVVHPAFEGLKIGLGFVRDAFQSAVDFIGQMWDRIKGITAKPIKFVIDSVYNNGIRAVWNKVAGWLGLEELDEMPMPRGLEGYASGGVLPGYTPGRDVHKFVNPATGQGLHLSGGEAIMRPEWTRAVGGPAEVDRMNRAARNGQLGQLDKDERKALRDSHHALGGVLDLAFAGGGVVAAMDAIVKAKYPAMVLTSGLRNSNDNHGRGLAADFAWPGAFGPHPAQLSLANDIADTYPGSMELIYGPGFSRQIKNGAIVGDGGGHYGFYAGAGDHSNHVHWAMSVPPTMPFGGGVFEGGSDGGAGGGGMSAIGAMVSSAFSSVMDPILGAIPDFGGGLWGGMPKALIDKVVDGAKEHLGSLAGAFGGSSALDLSGVAGDNLTIGQAAAEMVGWTGGEWAALKELWTRESGWNNNAQNPTSTAYGIAQFLDSTWGDFGPKTSDTRKQIEYGVQYIQRRYGTPSAALAFHDANNWYDDGGVANGTGAMMKNIVKPERVLNPAQTEAFEAWMDAGQKVDEINALVASVQSMQLDSPEVMADEIGRRVAEWIGEEQEPGSLRALAAALQSGIEWERVAEGMQRSAEAWANGEWVQVAEDRRLATPHEMASQVGENFLEEIAGELGGLIGLNNPYTARSIVDETGTIQLPQQANEIVPVTGDAPTVKADSGTIAAAAVGDQSETGTKETINVAVEVNVNGVQDPMAVSDMVVERMGRGLEQALGGTGRSL